MASDRVCVCGQSSALNGTERTCHMDTRRVCVTCCVTCCVGVSHLYPRDAQLQAEPVLATVHTTICRHRRHRCHSSSHSQTQTLDRFCPAADHMSDTPVSWRRIDASLCRPSTCATLPLCITLWPYSFSFALSLCVSAEREKLK